MQNKFFQTTTALVIVAASQLTSWSIQPANCMDEEPRRPGRARTFSDLERENAELRRQNEAHRRREDNLFYVKLAVGGTLLVTGIFAGQELYAYTHGDATVYADDPEFPEIMRRFQAGEFASQREANDAIRAAHRARASRNIGISRGLIDWLLS